MKALRRILYLLLISNSVFGQAADSISFAKFKWEKKKIAKKTKVFSYQVADSGLFKANQHISFVEVKDHKKSPLFHIAYETKTLIKTSSFGEKHQAIAAINGTFFDIKNGGSVDFIKVNDTVINQNKIEKSKARALHQRAAVTINNGKLSIKKWDGTQTWEENLKDNSFMVSGPLLSINNENEKLDSVPFNRLRHPRTAIGLKADGTVLLLTVDGRQQNSAGMSLFELAKVMQWLGCKSAINLDGGGSTTLWAKGYGENGIVNYPSDNKKWDHEGERRVANVIFIKSKDKQ